MAKAPDAYRTISEAAEAVGAAPHVLRFWESRFSFIRPMKAAGGRRFYRPKDIAVLQEVRRLLHEEGYTIKGVQKLARERGLASLHPTPSTTLTPALAAEPSIGLPRAELETTLEALHAAKVRLNELLRPAP